MREAAEAKTSWRIVFGFAGHSSSPSLRVKQTPDVPVLAAFPAGPFHFCLPRFSDDFQEKKNYL